MKTMSIMSAIAAGLSRFTSIGRYSSLAQARAIQIGKPRTSTRTTAQGKRAARKARNVKRHKAAMRRAA
ncbi:hypothetical protein [Burkholderia phage CSP3]|nr:hypothetical protein [Burkholderia phage CSP3]